MTTLESHSAEPSASDDGWRVKRHHALVMALALMAVLTIRLRWFSGASVAAPLSGPPVAAESPAPAAATVPEVAPEEPTGPSLLGSWRDQFHGERTMTFRPDGTGTMLIKLDAIGQAFYGEKLLFDLNWENRDGVMLMKFTGGEPKEAVKTISKLWGDTHEQKIELLSDEELHLRSTDSGNLYKLKRVE